VPYDCHICTLTVVYVPYVYVPYDCHICVLTVVHVPLTVVYVQEEDSGTLKSTAGAILAASAMKAKARI